MANDYIDLHIPEDSIWSNLFGRFSATTSIGKHQGKSRLSRKQTKILLEFLHRYRNDPGQVLLASPTSEMLGEILRHLFPGINNRPSGGNPLVLRVGPKEQQALTNIPWELAALQPLDDGILVFDRLLAATSFARTLKGTKGQITFQEGEKLKVQYCISDPDRNLQATQFHLDLHHILYNRASFIEHFPTASEDLITAGWDYTPRFPDLLRDIAAFRPHIFVLVSHGTTEDGIPKVGFEDGYRSVSEIAVELAGTGCNAMVILIACDLVYSADSGAAASGALTFIQHHIPAVIAMQSSVLVSCGQILLQEILHFFFSGATFGTAALTLPEALAFARRRLFTMTGSDAPQQLDWSFPALFLADDDSAELAAIRSYMGNYLVALKQLRTFNFPNVPGYFTREQLESDLKKLLESHTSGICYLNGSSGSGKSWLIRKTGDQLYEERILQRETGGRQIVYLDLQYEAGRNLSDTAVLINILNARIRELAPPGNGIRLINEIPQLKDTAGGGNDPQRLTTGLDQQQIIYIFDNADDTQLAALQQLAGPWSQQLKQTLICISGHDLPDPQLHIRGLSEEEAAKFLSENDIEADAAEIYQETGGKLSWLNELLAGKKAGQRLAPEHTDDDLYEDMAEIIMRDFSQAHLIAAGKLAHLSKGLSHPLSLTIQDSWDLLSELAAAGILMSRKGENAESFFFVPGRLARYWQEQQEDLMNYTRTALLRDFEERISTPDFFEQVLDSAGGFDYLRNIMQAYRHEINNGGSEESKHKLRNIPALAHKALYSTGRWMESLELSYLLRDALGDAHLNAQEWTFMAKTSLTAGLIDGVEAMLNHAAALPQDDLDQIKYLQALNQYRKETNRREQYQDMLDDYQRATAISDRLLAQTVDPQAQKEIKGEQALILYNRAILIRWWRGDLSQALINIRSASQLFAQAEDEKMRYVALNESADMRIDQTTTATELAELLGDLEQARLFFDRNHQYYDLALSYYRIARILKRYPAADDNSKSHNLRRAQQYYGQTASYATLSGSRLIELIAQGHILAMQPDRTVAALDTIIKSLKSYSGNGWAQRNLRNLWWLQAQIHRHKGDQAAYQTSLDAALTTAASPLLSPESITDRGVLAQLLLELYDLQANDQPALAQMLGAQRALLEKYQFESRNSSQLREQLTSINTKPYLYG